MSSPYSDRRLSSGNLGTGDPRRRDQGRNRRDGQGGPSREEWTEDPLRLTTLSRGRVPLKVTDEESGGPQTLSVPSLFQSGRGEVLPGTGHKLFGEVPRSSSRLWSSEVRNPTPLCRPGTRSVVQRP